MDLKLYSPQRQEIGEASEPFGEQDRKVELRAESEPAQQPGIHFISVAARKGGADVPEQFDTRDRVPGDGRGDDAHTHPDRFAAGHCLRGAEVRRRGLLRLPDRRGRAGPGGRGRGGLRRAAGALAPVEPQPRRGETFLAQLAREVDVLLLRAVELEHAGQVVEAGLGEERRAALAADVAVAGVGVAVDVRAQRRLRVVEVQRARAGRARPRSRSRRSRRRAPPRSARRSRRPAGGRSPGTPRGACRRPRPRSASPAPRTSARASRRSRPCPRGAAGRSRTRPAPRRSSPPARSSAGSTAPFRRSRGAARRSARPAPRPPGAPRSARSATSRGSPGPRRRS